MPTTTDTGYRYVYNGVDRDFLRMPSHAVTGPALDYFFIPTCTGDAYQGDRRCSVPLPPCPDGSSPQ